MDTQFLVDGEDKKERKTLNETFYGVVSSIMDHFMEDMVDQKTVSRILSTEDTLKNTDLKDNNAPEDYTESKVIKPLLEYLGYQNPAHKSRSGSTVITREADYKLKSKNDANILVESEPINKNLYQAGCGVKQVSGYLEIRSFRADLGIATDGFKWILIKYDTQDYRPKVLIDIDIRPFFQSEFFKRIGQTKFGDIGDKQVEEFRRTFSRRTIDGSAHNLSTILRERKKQISRSFYDDYIAYVFGESKKKRDFDYCLLDTITCKDSSEEDKRLFAVTLMNRLIFIRFLEDRGLVPKNLLNKLLKEYESAKLPFNFYYMYLKPLFYKVMNVSPKNRDQKIKENELFMNIPYLNGGLFRDVVRNEKSFEVSDDILKHIIRDLMERYKFALKSDGEALDPDILGNVFEKTINYITTGRKEKGAYYTPEEITSYITKNTIQPYVFDKLKDVLRESGWKESEIAEYKDLDMLISNLPKSPITLNRMLDAISNITVLDPACGSGHFLTSALSELTYIHKAIHDMLEDSKDLYEIKKNIISHNIFGVDIESSAVEIAKLRLWLSLIESIDTECPSEIDTLPNIEYNISSGNSLVGWSKDAGSIVQTMFTFGPEISIIDTAIAGLRLNYADAPDKLSIVNEVSELILETGNPDVASISKSYLKLKSLYSEERGEKAAYLRELLETIRSNIYRIVLPYVWTYVEPKSKKRTRGITPDPDFQKCFHWGIDFGNVLNNGGFDIIIGNPPYGVKFKDWESAFIKNTMSYTTRHMVSEMAFIEKGTQLVRSGGFLGMIVPKPITYSDYGKAGRDLLVDDLLKIVDVSKAFPDVLLEMIIFTYRKGCGSPTYQVSRLDGSDAFDFDKHYIDRSETFIIHPGKESMDLFMKLSSSERRMRDCTTSFMGAHLNSKATTKHTKFKTFGGKHISRFVVNDSDLYLPEDTDLKLIRNMMCERVVVQRIVAHVTKPKEHITFFAAIDHEGMPAVDTVFNIKIREGFENDISNEFIVCALNSKLIAWYCHHYVYSDAIRSMDLVSYYFGKIPLPSEPINNESFRTLYGTIRDSPKPKNSRGKPAINQELMDRMDRLIYEAYGLNDDEIQIIESEYIDESAINRITLADFTDE